MRKWMMLFIIFLTINVFPQSKGNLKRYAIIVGANDGGPTRTRLRYAVLDARSVVKVLEELGGLGRNSISFLNDPDVSELERTFLSVRKRITQERDSYERIELFFYYSGHSDEEGLMLGKKKYQYKRLKDMVKTISADLRISILDSCSSGAITRVKGGKKRAPFLVDSSMKMKGYAFITSSSHDEASQESDRIKGSFFTYYFISGLRGAADFSKDGRVTLNEVYQFAFHETLLRTEKTASGPQHPGYEIQMTGSGDVVITDIRKTSVLLIFGKDIQGRISIRNREGVFIAELNKVKGKLIQLSLDAEKYQVLLEKNGQVYQANITLSEGKKYFNVRLLVPVSVTKSTIKGPPEDYEHVPWSFAILPSISTGKPKEKDKVLHNVSINLFADYSDRLEGVGFGGMNIIGERAEGALFALAVNYIKGSAVGAQFSLLLNYNREYFSGAQFSLIYNQTNGNTNGYQTAIVNYAGKMNGAQNGFVNVSKNVNGGQFGLVNITTEKIKGVQFGLINYAKEADVVFGIINIIGNGRYSFNLLWDEYSFYHIEFKMGTKYTYSILGIGSNKDDTCLSYRIGLGAHFPFLSKFFIETDFFAESFYKLDKKGDEIGYLDNYNVWFHIRYTFGLEVLSFMALIGGIYHPIFYINKDGKAKLVPAFKNMRDREKGGFKKLFRIFFGIQIFFG